LKTGRADGGDDSVLAFESAGEGLEGLEVNLADLDGGGKGGLGGGAGENGHVELARVNEGLEDGSSQSTGGLERCELGPRRWWRSGVGVLTPTMATFLMVVMVRAGCCVEGIGVSCGWKRGERGVDEMD